MELINSEPTIILICGKARHGKTTTGEFIKEYYEAQNKKVTTTLIALYLKLYVKNFFGWDGKDETKPRELLQQLGTEVIRKGLNKETFFIDRTIEDIEILKHFFNIFIIDDIRFPLEIESLKASFKNVITLKLERNNFESDLNSKQLTHSTETALDNYQNYDYIIKNNGTLDELKEKVINVIKDVKIDG